MSPRGSAAEPRAFRPHVSLAYMKTAPEPRVAAWLQSSQSVAIAALAGGGVGMYSSWRSADGSRYALERTYPLAEDR
jgi:2'-5' RNA ligase